MNLKKSEKITLFFYLSHVNVFYFIYMKMFMKERRAKIKTIMNALLCRYCKCKHIINCMVKKIMKVTKLRSHRHTPAPHLTDYFSQSHFINILSSQRVCTIMSVFVRIYALYRMSMGIRIVLNGDYYKFWCNSI